eukprot:gene51139-35621_t
MIVLTSQMLCTLVFTGGVSPAEMLHLPTAGVVAGAAAGACTATASVFFNRAMQQGDASA